MDIFINADKALPPQTDPCDAPILSPLTNLMSCLGFKDTIPPLADFLRQVYQLEGEWLLCEPIYWEAGNNDAIILADARMLQLSDVQSRVLFNEVQQFLKADGIALHYHNAYTWLIRVDGKPKLNSLPTHAMLHRSMMSILKDLDKSHYWQKLMTELQMFLKNLEPIALPINGFWFYSDTTFHFKGSRRVWTDNAKFIAAFPEHVKALSLENRFDKNDIIWIENCDEAKLVGVKKMIGKHAARWFWNNMTYMTPAKSWWRNWMKGSSKCK